MSPREPSRRRWRLAARGRVSRRAHPASRTPCVDATSECGGTPEVEENKKARILAESGPLEFRERLGASSDAAASRMGTILGLAMIERLSVRLRARRQRQDAHERTRAGEGLGVAKGDPAVHDDVSGLGSVSTCTARARVSGGASCKGSSLFQATASSVNSLYCLRKGVRATSCCAPSTTLHDVPCAALRCTAPG